MTQKNDPVIIPEGAFSTETGILTLEISLGDYSLTGKTITAVFSQTAVETGTLIVSNGMIQLPIVQGLLVAGENYIQLNIREGLTLEQSPIMKWMVGMSVAGTDPAPTDVDIITELIAQAPLMPALVTELNSRIDAIITTPAEGVSAQEIIDARSGESTLGGRVDGIDSQLADIAINVKQFGAKGDGITDDAIAINAFIAANVNNKYILLFSKGTFNLKTHVVFGSNATIIIQKSAFLNVLDTIQLVFNCNIEIGKYKVFSLTGSIFGKLKPRVIFPEWFGADTDNTNITLNTSAINKCFVWAKMSKENLYYGMPLCADIKVEFDSGIYQINDWISPIGNNPNIVGVYNSTRIQQTNPTNGIFSEPLSDAAPNGYYGICGGKIENIIFMDGKRQLDLRSSNTGGQMIMEKCSFSNPDPTDWCVYYDGVSSKLTFKDCRLLLVVKFLWAKCDGAVIDNMEGAIWQKTNLRLPDNTALVENHTRMLKLSNILWTIDAIHDGSSVDINYRLFDNYGSVAMDAVTLDGPSGGRCLVWNYAKHTGRSWDDWNVEAYPTDVTNKASYNSRISIQNSATPSNDSRGHHPIILLKEGIPAIIELNNLNLVNGTYIEAASSFSISDYLAANNLKGSIGIAIKNNSIFANGYTMYPETLSQFVQMTRLSDSNAKFDNEGSVNCFLPKITSNLLIGKQYAQTSTSGLISIVDTDIKATDYKAGVFLISVTANKNIQAITQVRDSVCGLMVISTGTEVGSELKVEYTQLINSTPSFLPTTGLTITPVWWNGETESIMITPTIAVNLRIKVSDYDSGAGTSQRLNILCLNAQ